MSHLQLIADEILLDGERVGTLEPGIRASQRDRLVGIFDSLGDDAEYIVELKSRIAQLKEATR